MSILGSDVGMGMEDDEEDGNDVKRLGRVWVKERGTGDIMPWEGDLMDQIFDKLEQQVGFPHQARKTWS
jgi:GINS complex subunit 4